MLKKAENACLRARLRILLTYLPLLTEPRPSGSVFRRILFQQSVRPVLTTNKGPPGANGRRLGPATFLTLKFWIFTHLFTRRADACAPIATTNQVCQCVSNPLAMKNWLVHPGSAPSRQIPSVPATTATGVSN